MNWRKIALYAAALLVTQVAIGFLEGSLAGIGTMQLFAGSAISFVACGAVFAHLASRQRVKPFAHAWATLILQSVAGAVLLLGVSHRLGSAVPATIAIELLVLACALVVGTVVGSSLRHRTGQPAGA